MSAGFPVRPSRSAFGPTPKNREPVNDPEEELDADVADLLFWQVAGLGIVGPLAWVQFTGASATLLASGEAYDPHEVIAPPTVSRTGGGIYVVTYPATVIDRKGEERVLSLRWAKPFPQATVNVNAVAKVRADGRTVDVLVYNSAGSGTDAEVLLEVG
jgi:hypothetical protein